MSFDDIDKKFNKAKPVLLEGPWYWDTDDEYTRYRNVDEMMESVDNGLVVKAWEGGVTREFYVVTMSVPAGDPDEPYYETETREFASEEEANVWIKQCETELAEYEAKHSE